MADTYKIRRDIRLEIDLIRCTNTYSQSPCTASGSRQCYNTRRTCQDNPNFRAETQTLTLIDGQHRVSPPAGAIPCIDEVRIRPQTLNPDGVPRFNTEAQIAISNFAMPDRVEDDPYNRRSNAATWWGRLLTRDPYIVNRPARLTTLVQGEEVTTHWIVHNFTVPTDRSNFTLTLADPLRAVLQVEFPRDDNARLTQPLAVDALTANSLPAGIAVGTYLAIEDEIVRVNAVAGDTYTIARGQKNTEAEEHPIGADVQRVYIAPVGTHLFTLIRDILLLSGVNSEYLPAQPWQDEMLGGYQFHTLDDEVIIAEPVRVRTLLENFTLLGPLGLFWDAENARILPVGQSRFINQGRALTDEDYLDDPEVTQVRGAHVTEVILRYGPPSPTERSELRRRSAAVDLAAENDLIYGRPYVRDHALEFVPRLARNLVTLSAARLLARYGSRGGFPRQYKMDVPMLLLPEYPIGEVVPVTIPRTTLDFAGAEQATAAQVISALPNYDTGRLSLTLLQYLPVSLDGLPIPDNPLPTPGVMTEGTSTLGSQTAVDLFFYLGAPNFPIDWTVIVPAGARLTGLRATDEPALLIRNFAAGSNIRIEVAGGVIGYGGIGGSTTANYSAIGTLDADNLTAGTRGGDAIEVRDTAASIVIAASGTVGGGGGGGGAVTEDRFITYSSLPGAFLDAHALDMPVNTLVAAAGGGGAGFETSTGGIRSLEGDAEFMTLAISLAHGGGLWFAFPGDTAATGGTALAGGAGGRSASFGFGFFNTATIAASNYILGGIGGALGQAGQSADASGAPSGRTFVSSAAGAGGHAVRVRNSAPNVSIQGTGNYLGMRP